MADPAYTEDEIVAQARRAGLLKEAQSSWAEVDLGPILAGEEPEAPPRLLGRTDGVGLIYEARVHAIYGEPECGKSWFALALCVDAMSQDRHVVYIDFEDSPGTIVARLRALGVADEEIVGLFHYIRPDDPLDDQARPNLKAALAHEPMVCVVDGVTEAMNMHGLGPESNSDVAKFNARVVRPLQATGAAIVTIDHVTKDKDTRRRWAIGAQHKLAGIDGAAYSFEVLRPFGRGRSGAARLEVTKDRLGYIREAAAGGKVIGEFHLKATSGSDGAETAVAEIRPIQASADLGEMLSPSRQWVLEALPEEATEALTIRQIGDIVAERGHPLKRSTISKALGELREHGVVDNLPDSNYGPSLWWKVEG